MLQNPPDGTVSVFILLLNVKCFHPNVFKEKRGLAITVVEARDQAIAISEKPEQNPKFPYFSAQVLVICESAAVWWHSQNNIFQWARMFLTRRSFHRPVWKNFHNFDLMWWRVLLLSLLFSVFCVGRMVEIPVSMEILCERNAQDANIKHRCVFGRKENWMEF